MAKFAFAESIGSSQTKPGPDPGQIKTGGVHQNIGRLFSANNLSYTRIFPDNSVVVKGKRQPPNIGPCRIYKLKNKDHTGKVVGYKHCGRDSERLCIAYQTVIFSTTACKQESKIGAKRILATPDLVAAYVEGGKEELKNRIRKKDLNLTELLVEELATKLIGKTIFYESN